MNSIVVSLVGPACAGVIATVGAIGSNATDAWFDALLVLRYAAPVGDYIAVDDDSFGGTAAMIRKRLPETGAYFITATAAGGGPRAGEYWLRLRQIDSCPGLPAGARDE